MLNKRLFAVSIAIVVTLTAAAPAATDDFAPSGPWAVAYDETTCTIARTFSAGKEKATFGIIREPMGPNATLTLVRPDRPRASYAIGTLDIAGGVELKGVAFQKYGRLDRPGYSVTISVPVESLTDIARGPNLWLTGKGIDTANLNTGKFTAAISSLQTCYEDLLRHMGIDTADQARVVTPAELKGYLFSVADYPAAAIRENAQGDTHLLWRIETDGSVRDCRIIRSSESKELDDSACSTVRRNGHYKPAQDGDGKPVAAWTLSVVRWRLPFD